MNRQRYMAELSKLLSFMFKEDRAEILQHYNELLDNAEDEEALLEEFGSPTKLAVTISRNYEREERKLSVKAESKENMVEEEAEAVEFTRPDESEFKTIKAVVPEDDEGGEEPEEELSPVSDYSASYADIVEEIRREVAAENGEEYIPIFFEEDKPEEEPEEAEEEPLPEEEPEEEEASSEESDTPEVEEEPEAEEEAPEVEEAEEEPASEEDSATEDDDIDDEDELIEQPEEVAEDTEEVEEASEEEEEASEVEEESEETVIEVSEPEEIPEETVVEPVAEEIEEPVEVEEIGDEELSAEPRLSPALLILYLIFAIPIGLILLALLAAVTLCVLGGAAAVMGGGVLLAAFALSGIAVAADMILVIGGAIIAFALGLLLLWTGFWLILAAFYRLVDFIIKLGGRICMKEAE